MSNQDESTLVPPDDNTVRRIRKLEQSLAAERISRRDAERKLKQAESDLQLAEHELTAMLHMNDRATLRSYKPSGSSHDRGKATAIICVNDWHAEQTVEPDLVGGINEFSADIADARIARTWEQAIYLIDFAKRISNIDEVVLWAGGDLMNGMIHDEYLQTNWAGPTDAAQFVQDHLVSGIQKLVAEIPCDRFKFLATHGNHGRSTPDKRVHTQYAHSWERLIYHNVAKSISDCPKVSSYIERGPLLHAEIQGVRCRFSHGDTIKYLGGQSGVIGPASRARQAWDQQHGEAALTVIAHFHQYISTQNFVCCGSLIGFDPFAQAIKAQAEPPTQTLIVLDSKRGKVLTIPIFCESKIYAQTGWTTPKVGT